jgi:hypothetical protein
MTAEYPNIPEGAEFYVPVGPHLMAREVRIAENALTILLKDGRSVTAPLEWFPKLLAASPEEREEYEIVGAGGLIDWPELEESILIRRFLHQSAEGIRKNVEEGRDLIHRMVDELASEDVPMVERFVAFLSEYRRDVIIRSLSTAPFDDEPITLEEQRAVEEARHETEWISHEDVMKEWGGDGYDESDSKGS